MQPGATGFPVAFSYTLFNDCILQITPIVKENVYNLVKSGYIYTDLSK